MRKTKPKKCQICRTEFMPFNSTAKVCSGKCGLAYHKREQQRMVAKERKAFNAETRKRKARLKTRSDWMRETQTAFNAFIRARDHGKPCISCGRNNDVKWNAGHYLSVGAHPELRFSEFNVHKQCEHCNSYLSGNLKGYREGLLQRIGTELVEWLEGPHEALKPTVDELKFLKAHYREQLKQLRAGQ